MELDAFFFSVVHFFSTSRQFRFASAVNDMGVRTEAQRCSRRVHRDVAAANHDDLLASVDRGVVALEGLHQVVAGQVFVGRVNAVGLFARNVHEARQPGTRADKYRVVAFFVEQFVDGYGFADDDVRFDLDAEALDVFNFLRDDLFLRQTEFRNSVNQNAARFVERFENRHVVALLG